MSCPNTLALLTSSRSCFRVYIGGLVPLSTSELFVHMHSLYYSGTCPLVARLESCRFKFVKVSQSLANLTVRDAGPGRLQYRWPLLRLFIKVLIMKRLVMLGESLPMGACLVLKLRDCACRTLPREEKYSSHLGGHIYECFTAKLPVTRVGYLQGLSWT